MIITMRTYAYSRQSARTTIVLPDRHRADGIPAQEPMKVMEQFRAAPPTP